jgi:hypothetical protein
MFEEQPLEQVSEVEGLWHHGSRQKKGGMNISVHAGRPVTQLVSAPWWPAEELFEAESLD